jgi:hypothetical protein
VGLTKRRKMRGGGVGGAGVSTKVLLMALKDVEYC